MTESGDTADKYRDAEVRQFVMDLNETWVAGRFDELEQYFDPDVKMVVPGKRQSIDGVAPMVQSYRDFAAAAVLHHFEVVDVQVMPIDPHYICNLDYSVEYEINSKRCQELGRDIYFISPASDHLRVVWRTQYEIKADS